MKAPSVKSPALKLFRLFGIRDRIRQFASVGSVSNRLGRAAVLSGGLSVVVKAASLVKEILVAAIFGVSGQIDVYLNALMLIGVPLGIVAYGVQWTLIPEFVKTDATQGRSASRMLLRQVSAITLLILTGTLVVWIALLPAIVAHLTQAAGAGASESVRRCLLVLGVYYFASGTVLLGYGVLQAQKRFLINGSVPLVTPLMIAVLVVVVPNPSAETLAIGISVGTVAELIFVAGVLRRDGLSLIPGLPFAGPIGQPFFRNVLKLAGGVSAIGVLSLVEQTTAVAFGVGAVATLGYAYKLPALLNGLAVSSLGVALIPYFSEMLAKGDAALCRRTLQRFALMIGGCGVILSTALIAGSELFVRIAFHRGAFDEAAVVGVTFAQQAYLVQVPGFLLQVLASRVLMAQERAGVVGLLHLGQLLFFAVGALVAVRAADTVAAIALANSLAVTLTAVGGYLLASRSLERMHSGAR